MLVFAITTMGFVFRKAYEKPKKLNTLKICFTLTYFAQFWSLYHNPSYEWTPYRIAGALMLAISLVLFWWAKKANEQRPLTLAYHSDEPVHVNRQGPYRYIRHPFYSSYLACFVAVTLYTLSPFSLAGSIVMYLVYDHAAKFEEEKFMKSSLREQYELFMQEAGRFFPRLF